MEGQEYILKVPLKEMVLRKVAINLWNQFLCESLPTLIPREQTLELLMKKVKEKGTLLGLPSSLREKLMHLIPQIGEEVEIWNTYHQNVLESIDTRILFEKLCWTSEGTVNYFKTALRLIVLEQVDNTNRYIISCLYCLDDYIQAFWCKLSDNSKKRFSNEKKILKLQRLPIVYFERKIDLVNFWSLFLKGNINILINTIEEPQNHIYQYAFQAAAISGKKIATEYFFLKLSFLEKEITLLKTAQVLYKKRFYSFFYIRHDFPHQKYFHVVSYLLSQMSENELLQVFNLYPCETLFSLIEFPFQDMFLIVAEKLKSLLSLNDFEFI